MTPSQTSRLAQFYNVLFPWTNTARLKADLRQAALEAEERRAEYVKLSAFVRELQDKNEGLVETQRESNHHLRIATQKIADLSQKVVDLTERESSTLAKFNTALMQVANFQAFLRGIKIPIFPGVGPELPEAKPIDYEKMARQMPRSTRQAEQLSRQDFVRSFSTYLEEEAAEAEKLRQE